jgi:hypothetical protein
MKDQNVKINYTKKGIVHDGEDSIEIAWNNVTEGEINHLGCTNHFRENVKRYITNTLKVSDQKKVVSLLQPIFGFSVCAGIIDSNPADIDKNLQDMYAAWKHEDLLGEIKGQKLIEYFQKNKEQDLKERLSKDVRTLHGLKNARVFTNICESFNAAYKCRYPESPHSILSDILVQMIEYIDNQSKAVCLEYFGLSGGKVLLRGTTQAKINQGQVLDNYSDHAISYMMYREAPFNERRKKLLFNVQRLSKLPASECDHLERLAIPIINGDNVEIIPVKQGTCRIAVVTRVDFNGTLIKKGISTITSLNDTWNYMKCTCHVS